MKSKSYLLIALSVISIFLDLNCKRNTNNDSLRQMCNSLQIEKDAFNRAKHIIILPSIVCNQCLERFKKMISVSKDTLYVVSCKSSKEFYLLTGLQLHETPNAYVDSIGLITHLNIATVTAVDYSIENGNCITSHRLLDINHSETRDTVTHISVFPPTIELGDLKKDGSYDTLIVVRNIGKEPLRITEMIPSCSCINVIYNSCYVEPNDSLLVNIIIHPDSVGVFYREIYIYGNFTDAPFCVISNGKCIDNS